MSIEEKFNKALSEANVIFINKPELLYFGILSYGMEKEVVTEETALARTGIPSLGYTDGKKITFVVRPDISAGEIIFILGHEITHIISNHLTRRGTRDPLRWNIACDHVVNRVWKSMANSRGRYVKAPKDCVFFEDIHKEFPDITCEDVYEILDKNKKDYKISVEVISEGDGAEGQPGGGDGSGNGQQRKVIIVKNNKTGKTQKTGHDTEIQKKPGQNPKDVEKRCKELANTAKALWESNQTSKGNLPAELVEYLDEVLDVKLPWDEVLASAILFHSQSYDDPSWTTRNIYLRNHILPGYVEGQTTQTLIAGIDSSGSVSTTDLKKFVGVIVSSINYYKSIVVLVHDFVVHTELWFENNCSELEILEKLRSIMGRGGTSHKDLFDKIEVIQDQTCISSAIFLTDYYSDVEQIYQNYEWIKEVPTTWVLNTKDHPEVSLEHCKTQTIHI